MRKFVRRHRVAVALPGAVALLLVGAATTTAVQNRRIAHERDRAERAVTFLTELFEGLEPAQARGSTLPTRDILDRGAARVESELGDQPLLQARLFDVLGNVYVLRGHFVDAEPLLRRALQLRLDHLSGDDLLVAHSRHTLANLLEETDRHREAEALLEAAAEAYRRRLGPDDPTLAQVELDRALTFRAARRPGDRPKPARPRGRPPARPPGRDPGDLATALLYFGKVRLEAGDAEGAEAPIREALAIRRRLFGREHPQVANAIDGIGELMQAPGDYLAAEQRTGRRCHSPRPSSPKTTWTSAWAC